MEEIWKPVEGFEGVYSVSSHGRVRREPGFGSTRGRVLRHGTTGDGYHHVNMSSRFAGSASRKIHSMVAAAFLGPRPPGLQIDHLDGDRFNNRFDNLRYVSPKENINNPATKKKMRQRTLTKIDVIAILALHATDRFGQKPIAALFGVTRSAIQHVITRPENRAVLSAIVEREHQRKGGK